jgi:PKD repeat protein
LQYKNKKNLYKILFITILLGFIISLVGCNWLSFGLLNIFDPQAQIRVNYTDVDLTEGEGTIALEVYSLNEVEFIGTGFKYEYYVGTTKITSLTKMVGATFYVAPSTSPGTPGDITTITGLPLYFQEVQDYITSNPLVTEMTCTISLIGTDGAGHDITKSVTVDLPALQPGIDFTPPVANIATTPATPVGNPPLLVIFDASGSTDDRGIASYSWNFGDGSTSSEVVVSHTFVEAGTFIVILTVTDYFGNSDIATKVITVGVGEIGAVIVTTPSPATGFIPFTVGFDASGSTVASPPIVSYEWDFDGNGTTDATGVTAVHTFSSAGTYLVQLTVTDSAANEYVTFVTVIANTP